MERIRRGGCASWLPILLFLLLRSSDFCSSLNDEGMLLLRVRSAIEVDPFDALSDWTSEGPGNDPCGWTGIKCEDGKISYLNLKDLHLKGALVPELGQLSHLRYLILRNNCFYGTIPEELGKLQKLEVLDLAHNDLTGPVPSNLSILTSLKFISIQGNPLVGDRSPGLHNLCLPTEVNSLPKLTDLGGFKRRADSETRGNIPNNSSDTGAEQPQTPPALSGGNSTEFSPRSIEPPPPESSPPPVSGTFPSPSMTTSIKKKSSSSAKVWLGAVMGTISGVILIAVGIYYYYSKKALTIKPWATGLSGQLQKALVTGVTQLRRSELEMACEDFSNIIGELSDCTLYKGTLSSGVEIVVASTVVNSAKDWSPIYEAQFRKKIFALSKVNHKNFSNLLGYCIEDQPFTRMMVFEYPPNGTLHENLHVRDAEDLDWTMRLRIAMGVSYCLEHMSQLTPPVVLGKLTSTTVHLTEDSAAKVSDFEFWSNTAEMAAEMTAEMPAETVFQFGMVLLEIIAGRPPVLAWAGDYLRGTKPSSELIAGGVKGYKDEDVEAICQLVVRCCDTAAANRPTLIEVNARLREITGVTAEAAAPKVSPLWWAELEIAKSD
ncbi:protein MALE DISCOVERER 2-like [Wolffia australiana]